MRDTPLQSLMVGPALVGGDGQLVEMEGRDSAVKRQPRQRSTWFPAPPRGPPGGSGRLGAPRGGDQPTGRLAIVSGARARCLQSRRFQFANHPGATPTWSDGRPESTRRCMSRNGAAKSTSARSEGAVARLCMCPVYVFHAWCFGCLGMVRGTRDVSLASCWPSLLRAGFFSPLKSPQYS